MSIFGHGNASQLSQLAGIMRMLEELEQEDMNYGKTDTAHGLELMEHFW